MSDMLWPRQKALLLTTRRKTKQTKFTCGKKLSFISIVKERLLVGPSSVQSSRFAPYHGYCLPSASLTIVYLPLVISGNSQLVLHVGKIDRKLSWGLFSSSSFFFFWPFFFLFFFFFFWGVGFLRNSCSEWKNEKVWKFSHHYDNYRSLFLRAKIWRKSWFSWKKKEELGRSFSITNLWSLPEWIWVIFMQLAYERKILQSPQKNSLLALRKFLWKSCAENRRKFREKKLSVKSEFLLTKPWRQTSKLWFPGTVFFVTRHRDVACWSQREKHGFKLLKRCFWGVTHAEHQYKLPVLSFAIPI